MGAVELVLGGLAIYGAIGLLFAVPFAAVGAARIDPAARGSPWLFRLLILPGSAALWPWLLARWAGAGRPAAGPVDATGRQRRFHAALWPILGPLLLAGFAAALAARGPALEPEAGSGMPGSGGTAQP